MFSIYMMVGFGLLIMTVGMFGFLVPGRLLGSVRSLLSYPFGLFVLIAIRLLFGWVLIAAALETRFPMPIRVLGIIAIVAAFLLPVIGRGRILAMVDWWTARSTVFVRIAFLGVVAFGLFLIYAAI